VVCQFLAEENLDALSDDAALLTSELVTNAVRHASGPIHVDAYVRRTRVLLEVADDTPDVGPAPRAAGMTEENGRGMELIDKLAARWGWRTVGARKVVWLELAI
jgi:anti-sigma regulatory factor (Ser/Thr protein kinase)